MDKSTVNYRFIMLCSRSDEKKRHVKVHSKTRVKKSATSTALGQTGTTGTSYKTAIIPSQLIKMFLVQVEVEGVAEVVEEDQDQLLCLHLMLL